MASRHARWVLGVGAGIAVLASATSAAAELHEGDAAPPVTAKAWLNVKPNDTPTAERLKDKVVMIEFWGTWCGPCVRAMPHVQELWDRYRDRGLSLVAISYEEPDVMKPFLEKNGYTMPVGSDPDKTCVGAYGFSGWPHTFVVGKDGNLLYAGDPYGVEPVIEKALGLESSPGSVLSQYLASVGTPGARAAIERLVEKAVPDFDVRAWAAGLGGAKDAKVAGRVDVGKSFIDYARTAAEKRQPVLDQLASGAPETFDLLAWARDAFGRDFPVTQKELDETIAAKRFEAAVDAIIDRRPSAAVLSTAAKCVPLAVYCAQHGSEASSFARKALLCALYVFPGKHLSEDKNKALWADLAVSGVQTSDDRQHVVGVIIGGGIVAAKRADSYISRQLARSIVMGELGKGEKPAVSKLPAEIASQREQMTKEIRGKYGE